MRNWIENVICAGLFGLGIICLGLAGYIWIFSCEPGGRAGEAEKGPKSAIEQSAETTEMEEREDEPETVSETSSEVVSEQVSETTTETAVETTTEKLCPADEPLYNGMTEEMLELWPVSSAGTERLETVPMLEQKAISTSEQDDKKELSVVMAAVEVSRNDATTLAQLMYNEAGGLPTAEIAMVAWTVLNRVDSALFPNDIYSVVSAPAQFAWYGGGNTSLYWLAEDVLRRYAAEKAGVASVGRVLPAEYLYFYGDGAHNYFYTQGGTGHAYVFSGYPSPYDVA